MCMISALTTNDFADLEPFLHQLLQSVLSCILRISYLEDTQWKFRRTAAVVLVQLVDKYVEIYTDLKTRVLEILIGTIIDDGRPIETHFGAIEAINAFGTEAYKQVFMPILESYLQSLP